MQALYIGVEIGGTKLQVVVSDNPPVIKDRYRASVDPERGAEGILGEIRKGLHKLLGHYTASAVGIGFGGPVDWERNQIACSHHIEGWDGFDLGTWMKEQSGAPVAMDNDANVAGLAEATFGAGRGSNPVFYVTLGSGVGGGLICHGSIYHGAIPGDSEIGHLRLNRDGQILEHSCSGWAVDQKIRKAVLSSPESLLARCVKEEDGPPAKALAPALAQNDSEAEAILHSTVRDLALGLSHVVHLLHPEAIVIGGGLSLLGSPLLDKLQQILPSYLMKIMLPGPSIHLAALGEDVVPIGALTLAQQRLAMAK